MNNFLKELKEILKKSNFGAKLICLVLALALWAYVNSTRTVDLNYRIPVEFRNIPTTMAMANNQNHYVKIILNGSKDDIKNINIKNIKAVVNLENASAGEKKYYPVDIIKSDLPENVTIDTPTKKLLLYIEKRVHKRVRVSIRATGDAMDGFVIGALKVYPNYVVLSGAQSQLQKINSIATRNFFYGKLSKKINREAQIDTDDLGNINIDITKVMVSVPVYESAGFIKLECKIKIKDTVDRFKYDLIDDHVSVYIKSLHPGMNFNTNDIEAYVNCYALNAGEINDNLDGQSVERLCPVDILIKNKREAIKTFFAIPDEIVIKVSKR